MHPFRNRYLRLFTLVLPAAAGLTTARLSAAEPEAVKMVPFEVNAEFGADGVRIQNSHAVLNAHLLDAHGIGQMQDVTGLAPNLFTSNSDTRGFGDVLALRGVANSIFFSAPAVALYVDDVPSGSVSSYPSALLNVDRMVVAAGPQGTAYGRNAPGGVIDVRTREPHGDHHGNLQFEYGSFDLVSARAGFDGPLADELGYSASLGYSARDGYIDNTFLNRSADDRRALNGRGALYWKPQDAFQLRLGILAETVDDDATRLSSLGSPDPLAVSSDRNGVTEMDRLQFSLQARQRFAWGSLVATTSRQDWDLDLSETDLDLTALPLAFSAVVQREKIWTQEVRLESTPDSAPLQWRTGLFFSDATIAGDALREFVVPPGPFVPPGFVQTERTVFTIDQTHLAAFGSIDYALNERSTVEIGGRVEQVDSDLDRTKTSANNFGFPAPPEPALNASQDHRYVSVSTGLVHEVSDSLSLLARTSLAHKPDGFSGFTGNPRLARFDNERLWSTEAGLTFSPPKSRFGGSLVGFWSVIDDYQLERTVPNSTDFVVVNADAVTSRGLEAKFMWNPVERVWLDFQAGYTDAKFDTHADSSGTNVAGKRVPFIPRYTLRTGITVDLGGGLFASGSYAAVGRTFFDEQNTAFFSQASYGIVNAQLGYRLNDWSVTVYGHNLFDDEHYQFINPEIFAGSPGAPRRFGVLVSFAY